MSGLVERSMSEADQAALRAFLAAAMAAFKAGAAHLPDEQRPEIERLLNQGMPIEMRVQMLPNVVITCVLTAADGVERQLFALHVPDAVPPHLTLVQ
jgi:hypothetical protein